jgi:tripartite-type tricarboxylate transporter receptor subunit TctC
MIDSIRETDMKKRNSVATLLCASLLQVIPFAVQAQTYPDRPVKLVVPFAPGGGADITARAVAAALAPRLGQPVIVENKPGAGATIGAAAVAKSVPDGYTLLYVTPGPQMINPHLMASLPYDPVKDLVAVSKVAVVPSALVVHPAVPAKNVSELIALAKAQPNKLSFASAGIGATSHLAGELFKSMAGVELLHVPYKGTGAALQDLLGGRVTMAFDSIAVYLPHIKSGKVRALGVSMPERSPSLPDVPALTDELRGFDASPVNYISVPAGTPKSVIDRLNKELAVVLDQPELRQHLNSLGIEPRSSTPQEMEALIRAESEKWRKVIKSAGIKAD